MKTALGLIVLVSVVSARLLGKLRPCEPVQCRMRCQHGWAVDPITGCEICKCADPPKGGLVCPVATGLGTCVELCSSDADCSEGQLCCSNGCGHTCQKGEACKPVLCRIHCQYGWAVNEQGCKICKCAQPQYVEA